MRRLVEAPLTRQLLQFALVGGIGFVLDVAVFNALRLTVLAPQQLHGGPVLAKVLSTVVAIAANWVGNRYWTFGPHRRSGEAGEAAEFLLASLLGLGVGVACLWVSHYLLGLTSVLADNVASNGVGLLLGSVLRFWLYRQWVYRPDRAERRARAAAERARDTPPTRFARPTVRSGDARA